MTELKTDRLKLRHWRPSDLAPFASMNADPEVMRFYPSTLSKAESAAFAQSIMNRFAKRGWGFWAVELKGSESFLGFVGLNIPEYALPFSPCVEIGWRLSKRYWGKGYASEAARASLQYAFEVLKLAEVVAFASQKNLKSIALMERINMVNTKQNFDHPKIPSGHELQKHVLYRTGNQRILRYSS